MLGMDAMFKSLIGIDPEEMKAGMAAFIANIQGAIQHMVNKQAEVDGKLDRVLLNQAITFERLDDIEFAVGGRMTVSRNLHMEAVPIEALQITGPRN